VPKTTYCKASQFAEAGDRLNAEDDNGQQNDDDRPQGDNARCH